MPRRNIERTRANEAVIAQWPPDGDPAYGDVVPGRKVLEDFANGLAGGATAAVFPWSPGYDQDRQGNPLYPARPKVIVYCETPADIALSLAFAKRWGWPPTCRSGGHSTAGFSVNNSMVIDVSRLSYVTVDTKKRLARVGAGTSFAVVDSTLDYYKLHFPGGGCGDVCVGGYVQGGGYGFTSRMFGMSSDNVVELTIMLPDGKVVVARADSAGALEKELFWAVRGGTGNQFGVLMEVVYTLVPLWKVWGFAIVWEASKAAAALDVLQRQWMRGKTSKQLGYQLALASIKGKPQLAMLGMWNGTEATGRALLDPLVQATGGSYDHSRVETYAFLNQWLLDDTLDPPTGDIVELKRAGYLAKPLGVAGWQKVVDAFLGAPNKYGLAIIEAYGGRIAEIPATDSAFVHRAVDGDFFVDSFFDASGSPTSEAQAQQWLDSMLSAVAPGLNDEVYQNYPSRNLPDYKHAYWVDAVTRLETLKQQVDPAGLLDFDQTV